MINQKSSTPLRSRSPTLNHIRSVIAMADGPSAKPSAVPEFSDVKLAHSKMTDFKSTEISVTSAEGRDSHPHLSGAPLLHSREKPFKFVATWRFWGILVLGQILSWCIVSTNILTQRLALVGANIPAFQNIFNYALLCVVYTPWTWYKYGFIKWFELNKKDGWKYFILAFADVQGVSTHHLCS